MRSIIRTKFSFSGKRLKFLAGFVFILLLMQNCVSLKPYQMVYVNDPEMQMGSPATGTFENYAVSIREGSVIPGGKQTDGGCGCK